MFRTMSTALVALSLLGAPALAQNEQLQQEADRFFNEHGYTEVDETVLTTEQLAQIQQLQEEDVPESEIRLRIDEILVMDAGTSMFVSEEMRVMMEDPEYKDLRANARNLLTEAGQDPALADSLTLEQLAQIWFLQERDDVTNNPAELETRLDAILNES